VSQHVADLRNS